MNKVFKRIWNAARGCWVVVSEAAGVGQTRGCGKKAAVAAVVCLMAGMSGGAWAAGDPVDPDSPNPVDPEPGKPEDLHTKWAGDFTAEMINIYLLNSDIKVIYENGKSKRFSGPLPPSLEGMHLQAHQTLVNRDCTYGIAGGFENKGKFYTGSQTVSEDEVAGGKTILLEASHPGTFDNYGSLFVGANGFEVGHGYFTNESTGVINAIAWPIKDAYSFVLTGEGKLTNAGRITTSEDKKLQNSTSKNSSAFLQSGGELNNVNGGVIEAIGGTTSQGGPAYTLSTGVLTNEAGGSIVVVAGEKSFFNTTSGTFDTDAGVGFKFTGGTINNQGTIDINQSGNPLNPAFVQTGGELTNEGTLNTKGGNEYSSHGYSLQGGTFTNTVEGVINALGRESEYRLVKGLSSGINISNEVELNNYGTINAKGWFGPGITSKGTINNYGTINANSKYISGRLYSKGFIIGGQFNNKGELNAGSDGVLIAARFENEGIINAIKGTDFNIVLDYNATLHNGKTGVINIGSPNDHDGFFTISVNTKLENSGTININTPSINALGREVLYAPVAPGSSDKPTLAGEGYFVQSASSARINGNLLAFADLQEVTTPAPMPTNYLLSNTKKLDDVSFSGTKSTFQIGEMATFLQSGITGGTIHITDDDWAASVQDAVRNAIYGTGVSSDVAITFAGTGSRGDGFKSGGYTVAATEAFLGKGNAGAILYESDLASEKKNLVIGKGGDITKSFGYRTLTGTDTIAVKDGLELTLVGKGENDYAATGALTLAGGTLNLGVDNAAVTLSAGKLKDLTVGDGGKLNVAKGNYTIENATGTIGEGGLKLAEGATMNLHGNDLKFIAGSSNAAEIKGVLNLYGTLTAKGNDDGESWESSFYDGLRVVGKVNNYGTLNSFAVTGGGVTVSDGEFANYGSISSIGKLFDSPTGPGGTMLPMYSSAFIIENSKFINKSGSLFKATSGHADASYGLSIGAETSFVNENGAELIAIGGEGGRYQTIGVRNDGEFINAGKVTLQATAAVNALVGSNFKQTTGVISGNLLAFAGYDAPQTPIAPIKTIATKDSDTSTFYDVSETRGIYTLANFLQAGITGGTIHITDTDWSSDVQAQIKDAIYKSGVGSGVNITFGGTGTKGFESKTKVIDIAHTRNFLAVAGNEGAVLYEDDLIDTTALSIGAGTDDLGSIGFRAINSKSVFVKDGKALTLLGDGTKIAGDASGSIAVSDGTLNLGLKHDLTRSLKQGGELSTVLLSDAGKLSVADVNGTFRISNKLSLADKATLTNAGKLSVASVAFAGNNATVTNTGTTVVKTASGSGKGNTLKNAGIYSQTDLSAFGNVQNKGTLKTGELKVGAADQLVNGGTILAEKITVDGLLQNRNGTFALGTAAVAKYLEKHLDLAQQLKDLGETLPTSVEALLSAQADAEAASLTTLELADGERSVESDDEMSETTESTDFASLFATVQAANTPQGRLATREGHLAFAGFSTYADNRAQLERQLQSGLSGLWADVIASQSEMDGYKANRSGIAVGLQGTNDAGLTFGVAARYSDGKLKGDALTSENWTSAGGSTYAAWTNEDAFVSGFIGYDNLKTKGSDKFTNDVVSVGVKSGLKLAVGPVHVTPFVGGEVVHQKVKGLDAATTYRFPVGVGLAGQYETYGAWQVHPSLEVAFVPQAGNKVIDVTDKVDSRFTGNYAVESRLGIAVEKKNLMLGINYHGSAGDAGLRSHSLQANLRYRF